MLPKILFNRLSWPVIMLVIMMLFSCSSPTESGGTNPPPPPAEYGLRITTSFYQNFSGQVVNQATPPMVHNSLFLSGVPTDNGQTILEKQGGATYSYTRHYQYGPGKHLFPDKFTQTYQNSATAEGTFIFDSKNFPTEELTKYSDGAIHHVYTAYNYEFYTLFAYSFYLENSQTPKYKVREMATNLEDDGFASSAFQKEYSENGLVKYEWKMRALARGPSNCDWLWWEYGNYYHSNGNLSFEVKYDYNENGLPFKGNEKYYDEDGKLLWDLDLTCEVELYNNGSAKKLTVFRNGSFYCEDQVSYNSRGLMSTMTRESIDQNLSWTRTMTYHSHPVNPTRFYPLASYKYVYGSGTSKELKIMEWTEKRYLSYYYENEKLVEVYDNALEKIELPSN